MKAFLSGMFNEFADKLSSSHMQYSAPLITAETQFQTSGNSELNGYQFWVWSGSLRPMPENYRFLKCTVKAICNKFMYGIQSERIRPFRRWQSSDLKLEEKGHFCRAAVVFNCICDCVVSSGLALNKDSIYQLTYSDWDDKFSVGYSALINKIEDKTGKPLSKIGEISYFTIYNFIKQHKLLVVIIVLNYKL